MFKIAPGCSIETPIESITPNKIKKVSTTTQSIRNLLFLLPPKTNFLNSLTTKTKRISKINKAQGIGPHVAKSRLSHFVRT